MRCHVLIAAMVGAMMLSATFAAEPPPRKEPIGDWENGTYLPVLELPLEKYAREVIIPNPSGKGTPYYLLRRQHNSSGEWYLKLAIGLKRVVSPITGGGGAYRISEKDVIPILGELYLIKAISEKSATIERITKEVPESLRPNGKAQIICLTAPRSSRLFRNEKTSDEGWVKILEIQPAQQDQEKHKAIMKVSPPRTDRPPRGFQPKPFEATVEEGDVLATRYQGYRVLRIVPPQKVEVKITGSNGKPKPYPGNLVGWVELDPEPAKDDAGNLITRPIDGSNSD